MKKLRRGFTLVELLAVIAILGVLSSGVILSYSKYLKNAKERFYASQEDTVTLSGKEYFTDFRSALPENIGDKTAVDLDTLYSKKYLSRLKDYNGKECQTSTDSNANKVYAYKVANNTYVYYSLIDCNGYKTEADTKSPVITFNPNKAITNGNINVVMTVKDNKKVEYYSYEVIKDGTVISKKDPTQYTNPITITLKDEGTYVIKGHAIDSSGNATDKTSGKYVIDKTPPYCSQIRIESSNGSVANKWQAKVVKLKITPQADVDKWNFKNCFKSTNGSAVCKDDGVNIIGAKSKTLKGSNNSLFTGTSYTDNGHVYGKINAYDEAGNSCSVNTSEYLIDLDAPVIKNTALTSKTSGYNAANATLTFGITDRADKQGNTIYYRIKTDAGSYSNWKTYPLGTSKISVDINFSGGLDGKNHTVTIQAKDELDNQSSAKKLSYIVYKECDTTTSTIVAGTCSVPLGVGTANTTRTFKDKFTGLVCKTTTGQEKCCNGPKITETNWSSCSKSCGGGTQSKTVTTESCDGKTTKNTKSQSCNTSCCVEPGTQDIGSWSSCSKSCNGGYQSRTIKTYNCDGSYSSNTVSQACNTQCCRTPGSVEYDSWSSCSRSCNGGYQSRAVRTYNCDGSYSTQYESRSCNEFCCRTPGSVEYGSWSTCSATVNGSQSREVRTYNCDGSYSVSYDSRSCNLCVREPGSVEYGSWGSCSKSCGGGTRSREKRTYNCDGSYSTSTDKGSCNTDSCPAKPTCTLKINASNATKGNNGWYRKGTVNVTMTMTGSPTSYGINSKSNGLKSVTINSNGEHKITGYVKNVTGSNTCTKTVKYDKTPPSVRQNIYRKYKGEMCVLRPNDTYAYRYEVIIQDDDSKIYKSECQSSIDTSIHPIRGGGDGFTGRQYLYENFCVKKAQTKTCKVTDQAGNSKSYTCDSTTAGNC